MYNIEDYLESTYLKTSEEAGISEEENIHRIISLVNDIYNYKEVVYLLKLLQIKDIELYSISWEHIIHRLSNFVSDADIYTINNKISIKDNYFVTIIDKDILKISSLCELMEWNIKYCFINIL